MRPLDGITVVTLEHAIAAPFCTRQLADLGARVIKIERPGQRRLRARLRHACARPGLALRLDQPLEGKRHARRQARRKRARSSGGCSRAPTCWCRTSRRAPRRGSGSATPSCRRSIRDSSSATFPGTAATVPMPSKKAYDLLIQSESGFLSVTGTPETPSKAGNSIADISAGMYAYSSILAALLQRAKTGRGSHIDVSLLETMVEWMSFPLYYAFEGAAAAAAHGRRARDDLPVRSVPRGRRQARHVRPAERARVGRVLRQGAAAAGARDRSALREQRGTAWQRARSSTTSSTRRSRSLTAPEVVARLDAAGIANARINEVAEVWEHPQLAARGRWTEVGTPKGTVPALRPPAGLDGVEPRMDPVPALGEHTDARASANSAIRRRHRSPRCAPRRPSSLRRHTVPYQQILYDVRDRIATITLNRPEQLNAWTDVMAEEVYQAMHAAGCRRRRARHRADRRRARVLRRRRRHGIQERTTRAS